MPGLSCRGSRGSARRAPAIPAGRPPPGSDDRSPPKQQSAATCPGVAKRSSRSEPLGDRFGPAHSLTFAEVEQATDPPLLLSPESSRGVCVRSVAPSRLLGPRRRHDCFAPKGELCSARFGADESSACSWMQQRLVEWVPETGPYLCAASSTGLPRATPAFAKQRAEPSS